MFTRIRKINPNIPERIAIMKTIYTLSTSIPVRLKSKGPEKSEARLITTKGNFQELYINHSNISKETSKIYVIPLHMMLHNFIGN